jgi:serine/threonine-protein kinase
LLRLTTFGGLSLLQDGAPHVGPAAQRRRLALLALIASAAKRGVSREKLLGILWPDSEAEAGRHALQQALSMLRRSLNADDLFLGTAALQINPDVMSSDIAEFDEAISRGAHERAVRVYAGLFLDGFRLEGMDEFERWQDLERVRRAREYATALETLATDAEARRDATALVQWRRRLATAEPLSTRAALGLIQALVTAGDRAEALQFATVHATLVREHLAAEPDAAIVDWMQRLRSGEPTDVDAMSRAASMQRGDHSHVTRAADAPAAERGELEELKRALRDRYVLGDQIGEGTLFSTYAARDRRDTKQVELGIFGARFAVLSTGEPALRVLERVASLHDPRIVPILDCGLVDDILYFTTPLVDAPSLREKLARERQLPVDEAVRIAAELAGAFAYAHQRGVRHGDLRPKHVLLARSGIMVASMGVLEALDVAAPGGHAATTAVTVGAPAYQSPEQLAGEVTVDERSDVYSLGSILYEMLAGEPPFGSTSSYVVLTRKLTQAAPSVRERRDSVPERLDHVIARSLARVPADRISTALELRELLSSAGLP